MKSNNDFDTFTLRIPKGRLVEWTSGCLDNLRGEDGVAVALDRDVIEEFAIFMARREDAIRKNREDRYNKHDGGDA